MPTQNEKICLNTKEACHYLGIPRCTLDAWRKAGLITYIKAGRNYLYPKKKLDEFVSDHLGDEITKDGYILVGGTYEC